jgi:hypothetical protein
MAYKFTSEVFQVSANVSESAPNTLTKAIINLNLDSLSREILVIQYADIDLLYPSDLFEGLATRTDVSLNDLESIGAAQINNASVIASATSIVEYDGVAAVSTHSADPVFGNFSDTPIFVSATDNLYLAVEGSGNLQAKSGYVRMWCRRARADADTYAAILTAQFNN